METQNLYDLIIVGAGPAGLAASIYASRYNVKHMVIGALLGGQISQTHLIDNYPGLENMTGMEFAKKWANHAKKYGTEIIPALIKNVKKEEDVFLVFLEDGKILKAKTLILATGVKEKKLNISGEKDFAGRGISYCATCDGFFYKNKIAAVVGGGNSAAGAAMFLANICQKVYLIVRKKEMRAEPYWQDAIKKDGRVEIVYEANVLEVSGKEKVEKIKLDKKYQGQNELKIDGLFIEVGAGPNINYTEDLEIATDEEGYIKIQNNGATSVSGIWAAGDITDGSDKFRQVITSAAEGAIAARSVFNWLKSKKIEIPQKSFT